MIGPNGAGKTTLLRMITGEEQPDEGTLKIGETVKLAYVDQSRDALDPDKNVWEEISGGLDEIMLGERSVASRAYVAGFNFKGTDQQKKVGKLSGGERNRLHLAKLLRSGGNLLLLDEPTNDLDTDTLRALEEALLSFAGCAVVVSHDRWFLDRIATHVLAFEGDSQVRWFEGNFEAYESFRHEQLGAEADRPHRITYKKLVRNGHTADRGWLDGGKAPTGDHAARSADPHAACQVIPSPACPGFVEASARLRPAEHDSPFDHRSHPRPALQIRRPSHRRRVGILQPRHSVAPTPPVGRSTLVVGLSQPDLVGDEAPDGVELVVADPPRDEIDSAGVYER